MIFKLFNCILFITTFVECLCSQQAIKLVLIDESTQLEINGAHGFINNSSIGSFSDESGSLALKINNDIHDDLVITHIAYESIHLDKEAYLSLGAVDTLLMSPSYIELASIVIEEKRGKQWKKQYNKVKAALLGSGQASKKCEILNPEVLSFKTENDKLYASSSEPLKIENHYLGYDLRFSLDELEIKSDGSSRYQGDVSFVAIDAAKNSNTFKKNRQTTFNQSLRKFLKSLAKEGEKNKRYKLREVRYNNGEFELISEPKLEDILVYDQVKQQYKLKFSEFLEITDLEEKSIIDAGKVKISKAEQAKFGGGQSGERLKVRHAQSLLYKLDDYIYFDHNGFIINKAAVREYGNWADHRLALSLPLDYEMESVHIPKTFAISNSKIENSFDTLQTLLNLALGNIMVQMESIEQLDKAWSESYLAPLLDIMRVTNDQKQYKLILNLIQQHFKDEEINNYYDGLMLVWKSGFEYPRYYGRFKSKVHAVIDQKFERYFDHPKTKTLIPMTEAIWGGVKQDGIPPLRQPKMTNALSANYLEDDHIVFGIYINGIAKAYPKRILAWHEFFVDHFGKTEIAGVYCTLCGTMIPYETKHNGIHYNLGTSGFLYQSNKLMYDQKTQSLWNTIDGQPVIGPLVGKDISLTAHPVVTTTWKEWKSLHPGTKVLSLDTGHNRNYDEGEAYKKYYSSDQLMFPVPIEDNRLQNKSEVLIIRTVDYDQDPLAISVAHLNKTSIVHTNICDESIVVITNKKGSGRAYYSDDNDFKYIDSNKLKDKTGNLWQVNETHLISQNGTKLDRIPAHNSFWFAWLNMHPNTRLIK